MFFRKSYKEVADEVLMDLICKGDQQALSCLYERYYPVMMRYFMRMVSDMHLAKDLVQDLFIRVIENSEIFDKSRKFSPWIFRIAGNLAKNSWRRNSRRQSRDREWSDARMETDSTAQERIFQAAVMKLDEADLELFTLRYELQLSHSQLSEILQIPEGTVKSRCFALKQEIIRCAQEVMTEFNVYE